jgi:small subunit ribosomal protein S1
LTVEEPKITDTENVAEATETATDSPEAAATEETPVEATAADPEPGDTAPAEATQTPAEAAQATAEAAPDPEAEAAAPAEQPSTTSEPTVEEAPAQEAAAETAEAPVEAAPAQEAAAETAEAPVEAAPAQEAAAPVDLGPEPTTMEELLAEQSSDIPSLKHGDVVEGKIVRIDKDEMLVDVGAKSEGVVSNRELYGRNTESQPDLNIGDTVLVYVLQPESSDGHAVLSLRRAGLERKWRAMQEQFDEGVIIEAPVIDHNKGGLIVDCGIRGFVPISQIVDFPRRPQNDQPRDAAQEIAEKLQPYVGRKLRLKILEVNRKANRLILSEKVALYEERREKRDELFSSLETGQKVTGTVRSIAPFGIFVDLGGIDGLVHKSELSWNKVNNPEGSHEVGDEVEAEVIDINHERGRISLSIRRLLPDPWQSTVADLKVGDVVEGTVTKIVNFGAFVRVKDGLEGLIHISELSHQRVAHPGDVVHEGQTLELKIISLDSDRHRLGLSLKQAQEAPARPPRERRPRGERGGYDRSQAIQEPEGGIDNTLAAAFAQVRQQIAEQDAAQTPDTEDAAEAVEQAAIEVETEAVAAAAEEEAVAETAEAVEEAAVEAEVEAVAEALETTDAEAQAEALEVAAEAEEVAEEAEAVAQAAEAQEAEALEEASQAEAVAEGAAAVEAATDADAAPAAEQEAADEEHKSEG